MGRQKRAWLTPTPIRQDGGQRRNSSPRPSLFERCEGLLLADQRLQPGRRAWRCRCYPASRLSQRFRSALTSSQVEKRCKDVGPVRAQDGGPDIGFEFGV